MRSELDDLLDEVNGYFDPNAQKSKPSGTSNINTKPQQGYTGSTQGAKGTANASGYNKDFDEIFSSPTKYSPTKNVGGRDNDYQENKKKKDDSLDDLIRETEKLTTDVKDTKQTPPWSNKETSSLPTGQTSSGSKSQKCFVSYLGPSTGDKFNAPCERLRCMQCDFIVKRFENCKWDDSSDYYFFRNYIGNTNELNKKLEKQSGSAAYACQCSWKNVNELQEVSKFKDVKWVCAGH